MTSSTTTTTTTMCFGPDLQDKFGTAKTGTVVESTICRLHDNCVYALQRFLVLLLTTINNYYYY